METKEQTAVTQATPEDSADEQLAKFVAENRQHLPPLPVRPAYEHLDVTPETAERAAERERKFAERAEMRQQAELTKRRLDLIEAAGQRYRGCTLQSFKCSTPQQSKVVDALARYLDREMWESVILFGPVGTGKDHLAFAICRAAVKSGKTVRWINGQQWFGSVRDAMDTDRTEASLVAELTRPAVLCISDPLPPVGTLTQHQSTMLYRVVDARYSKDLPTICTINVSSDQEADERMGAATWDRLTHDAYKLFCNWPSYRKPAREV